MPSKKKTHPDEVRMGLKCHEMKIILSRQSRITNAHSEFIYAFHLDNAVEALRAFFPFHYH
jgi:hypothetical protein